MTKDAPYKTFCRQSGASRQKHSANSEEKQRMPKREPTLLQIKSGFTKINYEHNNNDNTTPTESNERHKDINIEIPSDLAKWS